MPSPNAIPSPAQRRYLVVRGAFERFLALGLFLALSPLLTIVALGVWLQDLGPPLYSQVRVGRRERPFRVWKFRTMIQDADRLLVDGAVPAGVMRVTPIGRVLRLSSIDEVPQLINIMAGQMSFVGPRPVLPETLAEIPDDFRCRFKVLPGMTGLAQVTGRNTLPLMLDLLDIRPSECGVGSSAGHHPRV